MDLDDAYDDEDEWEPSGNPRRELVLRVVAGLLVLALVLPIVYAFVRVVLGS